MDHQEETDCNTILSHLIPTKHQHQKRMEILHAIIRIIEEKFINVKVFPCGSTPLKTYSADSADMDFTILANGVTFELDHLETFFTHGCHGVQVKDHVKPTYPLGVEVLKCVKDGIDVDITINQFNALRSLYFLEFANHKLGKDNLLKRCIIMTKWWCKYQGCIINAKDGLLSTYSVEIMTLYLLTNFSVELNTPLKVLKEFIAYFSKFQWGSQTVSIHNSFVEELSRCYIGNPSKYRKLIPKEVGIVDPVDENNNIGSKKKGADIVKALKQGESDGLNRFFKRMLNKYGNRQVPKSNLCSLEADLKNIDTSINKVREMYSRFGNSLHSRTNKLQHASSLQPQPLHGAHSQLHSQWHAQYQYPGSPSLHLQQSLHNHWQPLDLQPLHGARSRIYNYQQPLRGADSGSASRNNNHVLQPDAEEFYPSGWNQ